MFDNKLKSLQKCCKNEKTIETNCLRKCIKWSLAIRSEEQSNCYGDYKTTEDAKVSTNISQLFPIDVTKQVKTQKTQKDKFKFTLDFIFNKNNTLLCSRMLEMFLNVKHFNIGNHS